jgi:ABC-type glutathione transport system ATPase component
VDLDLNAGETLALVGESGSGKSTIARLVLQLVVPDEGSIELDGQRLLGLDGEALRGMRRRMQMIFQDPYGSLDPTLSIRQVLGEPFRVHFRRRPEQEELERLLGDVGLPPAVLERMPHELSGGQRQRVAIARALAVQPEFIACDEIVSALDVSTRAQILTLMRSLQSNRSLSMLFITHDLAIVPYIAQQVAVIYRGEIVERGTVDAVFSRPQHAYTQALLAAVPIPDPRLRKNGARAN